MYVHVHEGIINYMYYKPIRPTCKKMYMYNVHCQILHVHVHVHVQLIVPWNPLNTKLHVYTCMYCAHVQCTSAGRY